MTVKHIPEEGEFFSGYVPVKVQTAHVTIGAATTNDVVLAEIAAGVPIFNVTRPIVVYGLWTQTEIAFTSSVTLTVGDTTTADRFIADTTMNPASTGAVLIASTGLSVPYVYSAAQDITVDVGGATVAAGLAHVYLQYAILED